MIRVVMFSDLRRVSDGLLSEAGGGPVLIIDSAMPDRHREGAAARLYGDNGVGFKVCDPLTETLPDLSDFTVVHLSGGNPFRLLRAARECGLEDALIRRSGRGTLRLMAGSAGAMILAEDVSHAAILAPDLGLSDKSGFGWIPGRVMPHIDKTGHRADVIREAVRAAPEHEWTLLKESDISIMDLTPRHEAGPYP